MRARADEIVGLDARCSMLDAPSRTPASIRAFSFHRNDVAADMPVSVAISATASPTRRRCEICRRTEFGYDLGTVTSYGSLCLNSHMDGSL